MEMGSRYLDALHTFFGIGAYTCIAADGMDVAGFDAAASLAAAIDRAKALARTFCNRLPITSSFRKRLFLCCFLWEDVIESKNKSENGRTLT